MMICVPVFSGRSTSRSRGEVCMVEGVRCVGVEKKIHTRRRVLFYILVLYWSFLVCMY